LNAGMALLISFMSQRSTQGLTLCSTANCIIALSSLGEPMFEPEMELAPGVSGSAFRIQVVKPGWMYTYRL
jgi:hypothetical protein